MEELVSSDRGQPPLGDGRSTPVADLAPPVSGLSWSWRTAPGAQGYAARAAGRDAPRPVRRGRRAASGSLSSSASTRPSGPSPSSRPTAGSSAAPATATDTSWCPARPSCPRVRSTPRPRPTVAPASASSAASASQPRTASWWQCGWATARTPSRSGGTHPGVCARRGARVRQAAGLVRRRAASACALRPEGREAGRLEPDEEPPGPDVGAVHAPSPGPGRRAPAELSRRDPGQAAADRALGDAHGIPRALKDGDRGLHRPWADASVKVSTKRTTWLRLTIRRPDTWRTTAGNVSAASRGRRRRASTPARTTVTAWYAQRQGQDPVDEPGAAHDLRARSRVHVGRGPRA